MYRNCAGHVRPGKRSGAQWIFTYLTSLRIGDVLNLTVSDYDNEFLRVKEGKTGIKTRIEMSPEPAGVIDRARNLKRPVGSFYLITNRFGRQYSYNGFASAWRTVMLHALGSGIIQEHFTFHDIRAKHLTDRDDLELNAQLTAGHTDPQTTARYIRNKKGRRFLLGKRVRGNIYNILFRR